MGLRKAETVETISFHCISVGLIAGGGRCGELRRGLERKAETVETIGFDRISVRLTAGGGRRVEL